MKKGNRAEMRAPAHLSAAARDFYRRIVSGWELGDDGRVHQTRNGSDRAEENDAHACRHVAAGAKTGDGHGSARSDAEDIEPAPEPPPFQTLQHAHAKQRIAPGRRALTQNDRELPIDVVHFSSSCAGARAPAAHAT